MAIGATTSIAPFYWKLMEEEIRVLSEVCWSILKNWRPYYNPVHGQA